MFGSILRDIVKLGWPVLIAQLAVMINGVIDTVMAGRLGAEETADGAGTNNCNRIEPMAHEGLTRKLVSGHGSLRTVW